MLATYYTQILGQVVRGAREIQQMDLASMATAIELSSSGWSRVETGDTVMSVAHLRRAASRLRVEPWTLVQRADVLSVELTRTGFVVHDDKPRDVGKALLGSAAILAIVAGAAALAAHTAADAKPKSRSRK